MHHFKLNYIEWTKTRCADIQSFAFTFE